MEQAIWSNGMKLFEFPIMKPGDFGTKGKWDSDRLQRIKENYDSGFYQAPLVLGHPKHDSPAHGWVKELFMKGGELWAKATVHDELRRMVREGLYGPVSAKIGVYNNLRGMGEHLRHVGFQGAQPPVMKGMQLATFAEGDWGELTGTETCDITEIELHDSDDDSNLKSGTKENDMGQTVELGDESKGLLKKVIEGLGNLGKPKEPEKDPAAVALSEAEDRAKKAEEELKTLKAEGEKKATIEKATAFAEKVIVAKKATPAQKSVYIEIAQTKTAEELDKLFSELPTLPDSMFMQQSKPKEGHDKKASVSDAFKKMLADGHYDELKEHLMSEMGKSEDDAIAAIRKVHNTEFSEEDAAQILQ